MPPTDTGVTKAREVFTEHGGMLRTSKALRLGIHPRTCTLFVMPERSNRSGVASIGSPPHRPFLTPIWFQLRFGFHALWSALFQRSRTTA